MRGVAGVDLTEDLARELGAAATAVAGPGCRVVLGPRHPRVGPGARGRPRRRHRRRRRRRAHGRGHPDSRRRDPGGPARRRPGLRHLGLAQPVRRQRHQVPGRATGASCPTPPRPTSRRRWARPRAPGGGSVEPVEDAVERYADWLARDVRRGRAGRSPGGVRLRERGRRGRRPPRSPSGGHLDARFIGADPDGRNINDRRRLDAPRAPWPRPCEAAEADCGLAFDGDADRCLAVDRRGRPVNGDAIIAALAIERHGRHALAGERVVVTSMTNLGLPPPDARARDRGRGDRRRRPLRARADARDGRDARRRAVRPRDRPRAPHDRRRARDGAHAARRARPARRLDGRRSSTSCGRSRRSSWPCPPTARALEGADRIWQEVRAAEAKLGEDGRVVLRASGTEAVVRVMVEAADATECERLCDHLVDVVDRRNRRNSLMCGIVGYVGSRPCKELLLTGARAARVPRATTRPGSA